MSNKTEVIAVRVTDSERKIIQEKADKLGLSISSYVRMLALKD